MGNWKKSLVSIAIFVGLSAGMASAETVYSVREGDTIDSVASVHKTTSEKIRELNPHLAENGFEPGLILLLPDNLAVQIERQQQRVSDPVAVAGVLHDPPKAEAVPVTAEEKAKVEHERRRKTLASRRGQRVRALASTAQTYLGTPYRMGGTTRRAIDCSAFTQNVFAAHGIKLPRTADVQYNVGKKVPRGQEQPGDMVFFETYLPGASHVGIYLGGGKFIHASSSRGVTITPLNSYYFGPRYIGAKRVF
jgi:cell wall-associated NlpC family hydrolase